MSTDLPGGDEPVFANEPAPAHGPNFWNEVEARFGTAAAADQTAPVPMAAEARNDRTAQMPAVAGGQSNVAPLVPRPASTNSRRWAWPLAAAAALLLIVGSGVAATRGGDDGERPAEVVAGPDGAVEADAALLDGPQDGTNTDPANPDPSDPEARDLDAGGPDLSDDGESNPVSAPTPAATEPVPTRLPIVPVFDEAAGFTGDILDSFVPQDGGLPDEATLLATWSSRALSWYGVIDGSGTCDDAHFSEIRYVNGSGITQPVRDPQLKFSGEISHFTIRSEQSLAAWLVSCGSQLEMHVATLASTGEMIDPDLVWFGEGSVASALIIWDQDEVSLNAIDPDGRPFAVDYDIDTRLLSRNDGPSRIMIEAGAPGERDLTPLAASPDAGLTYWSGVAPAGTVSACPDLFGSGVADTLWLRQGEGQWLLAAADETPLGLVTAAAIEPERNQVAFADVCDGQPGRVLIGTQLPDGRIGNLYELDLTPYVPGFASQLFWVNATTLRIETDNSVVGVDPVRYDFRFEGDRENAVMLRLN